MVLLLLLFLRFMIVIVKTLINFYIWFIFTCFSFQLLEKYNKIALFQNLLYLPNSFQGKIVCSRIF